MWKAIYSRTVSVGDGAVSAGRTSGGNVIEVEMIQKKVSHGNRSATRGPSIAAVALWGSSKGGRAQLLTDEERARLSVIATVVRFKKGTQI
jgi:hypothetical protein